MIALLVIGGVGIGVGSAWASASSWTSVQQTEGRKAHFTGDYRWYSNNDHHGGFEIAGALQDLDKSNGRGVKFQVQVEGYAPDVYPAPTDQDLTIPDVIHYTGDQTLVVNAGYQTCQVNSILPDNCQPWVRLMNPFR